MREQLDAVISKGINWFAITGAGVGGVNGIINRVPAEAGLSIAEWGGIVGIAGGIILIIERIYNIYTKYSDRKKENPPSD